MKIKDLMAELSKFDKNTEVGGVVVEYIDHSCNEDSYCYCLSEQHEFIGVSIVKQDIPASNKDKKTFAPKIWIRGD